MDNKNVGWLIVGISIFIFIIIAIFYFGAWKIIGTSCSHGTSCGMYSTLKLQTGISTAIALLISFIGVFFILTKTPQKVITKKIIEKKKALNLDGLDKKEKEAVEIIKKENGAMFQRDLMEKIGIGKVGITRLLDKLEAKQIIERKRRGMNNIVVLK
jgi:uncharacterized membrane protein